MYAKFSKCEFWLRSVTLLGHVVSDQAVEVDPKKIIVVKNWPRPLTPKDIRSFLCLVNYYNRFFKGFSCIIASLILKKKVKFEWSEKFIRASKRSKTDILQPQCIHCRGVVKGIWYIVMLLSRFGMCFYVGLQGDCICIQAAESLQK